MKLELYIKCFGVEEYFFALAWQPLLGYLAVIKRDLQFDSHEIATKDVHPLSLLYSGPIQNEYFHF